LTANWSISKTTSSRQAPQHTIEVVIDRLLVKAGIEHRWSCRSVAMKWRAGWCRLRWWRRRAVVFCQAGVPGLRHQLPQLDRGRSPLTAAMAPARMPWLGSRYEFDPAA